MPVNRRLQAWCRRRVAPLSTDFARVGDYSDVAVELQTESSGRCAGSIESGSDKKGGRAMCIGGCDDAISRAPASTRKERYNRACRASRRGVGPVGRHLLGDQLRQPLDVDPLGDRAGRPAASNAARALAFERITPQVNEPTRDYSCTTRSTLGRRRTSRPHPSPTRWSPRGALRSR